MLSTNVVQLEEYDPLFSEFIGDVQLLTEIRVLITLLCLFEDLLMKFLAQDCAYSATCITPTLVCRRRSCIHIPSMQQDRCMEIINSQLSIITK